jgi:hypothetical protein
MQEQEREGKTEKEKDNRSLGTMMSFLNFLQRFPESGKSEHIIKIREAMRLKRIVKETIEEEITEYKREYKKSKEESKQKSTLLITLLNTLFNTLFITLLGTRRKEYA